MEFEIFNNLDLEFFELSTQTPNDEEQIIIILKAGVPDGNRNYYNYSTHTNPPETVTSKIILEFARYVTYKTRAAKFKCNTAYRARIFDANDIICWGRLK
jgi:hypothetical protein